MNVFTKKIKKVCFAQSFVSGTIFEIATDCHIGNGVENQGYE